MNRTQTEFVDREVKEAFQRREIKIERRINYIRLIGLFLMSLMDLFNFSVQGLLSFDIIVFFSLFSIIFLLYFAFVHVMTNPSRAYSPWLKYLTITIDYLLLISIVIDSTQGNVFHLQPETMGMIMSMCLILVNLLSALRHSRVAILYSTGLASIIALALFKHLALEPTLLVYGPAMMFMTGLLTLAIANNMSDLFLKLRHRERLMRFLSPEIVAKMDSGSLKLELGGEMKEVTILMTDLRGFTSLSEERNPFEIVSLLNEYFTAMSSIIFKYNGTIDKFIGDAIMAVYGTPESQPDDTLRALQTAQEMLETLKELNKKWKANGFPELQMGIALHTGQVLAGNIGSPKRMEYTVIGDTVNVTSRIESMNKTFNTHILFTSETYAKIKDQIPARMVGDAEVRGRKNQIQLYTLD